MTLLHTPGESEGHCVVRFQAGAQPSSLALFGAALLLLRNHVSGAGEDFVVFGTLICALGMGFALSAAASFYLSKSFGLLNSVTNHGQ